MVYLIPTLHLYTLVYHYTLPYINTHWFTLSTHLPTIHIGLPYPHLTSMNIGLPYPHLTSIHIGLPYQPTLQQYKLGYLIPTLHL